MVDVESLARCHTENAIQRLAGIMKDSPDEGVAVAASKVLLDRGWGRPKQDNTHEHKGEFNIILRDIMAEKKLEQKLKK